jgi:hypothetical protein
MPPSHLSHAPSHLHGFSSFDTSDNLSSDHDDASCRSEIGSYIIGILPAFSHRSDLASNLDEVLEKSTSQVHLTPGSDIDAMTAPLRWVVRNAASVLDPNNGSTAAVPNIADPLVCERKISSTLADFCGASRPWHKYAWSAGLETITLNVAPTTPSGQSVTYP